MFTSHTVAEFVINYAHEMGDPVTNLQLQKLLYYIQGFYLALYDEPLFSDKIQAMEHGPVVYEAYRRFSEHKKRPIEKQVTGDMSGLSSKGKSHVRIVMQKYRSFYPWDLRELSHNEAPWLDHPNMWQEIPNSFLKNFFLPRLGALQSQEAIEKARSYINNKYGLILSDQELNDIELYLELEDEKRELYELLSNA